MTDVEDIPSQFEPQPASTASERAPDAESSPSFGVLSSTAPELVAEEIPSPNATGPADTVASFILHFLTSGQRTFTKGRIAALSSFSAAN